MSYGCLIVANFAIDSIFKISINFTSKLHAIQFPCKCGSSCQEMACKYALESSSRRAFRSIRASTRDINVETRLHT